MMDVLTVLCAFLGLPTNPPFVYILSMVICSACGILAGFTAACGPEAINATSGDTDELWKTTLTWWLCGIVIIALCTMFAVLWVSPSWPIGLVAAFSGWIFGYHHGYRTTH